MKKSIKLILSALSISIFFFMLVSLFWLADLRTPDIKNNTQDEAQIAYAKKLLAETIKSQGLDNMDQFSTYEVIASDNWKGTMGQMGNPWSWNKDTMVLRFSIGDFDGQVEVLEGEQKGFVAGIQSWDYYEKVDNQFHTEAKDNDGIIFTLAAYHYFFELANRLSNAPFIRYAGEGKLKGKPMEKIFVSWGNECTNDYDHYLLWISKESKLIEAVTFTTRDNPMPAPVFMYGSLRFDDYREINGVLIPFTQTAQLMNPKDDINNFIHQFKIQTFTWDHCAISEIRPLSGISPLGDEKLK